MVMGFRERRLGCRLYVDRQSDANILKKLDRMLVDGSFSNQTELIKRGIELAYEEAYSVLIWTRTANCMNVSGVRMEIAPIAKRIAKYTKGIKKD